MQSAQNLDFASLIADKNLDIEQLGPKERILVAALRLFVKQGYFNTNVPDLSKESKCSVGSIYHHYKNKEEVAAALYAAGIYSFREALQQTLKGKSEIEVILKTIVRFFLEFTERNRELSTYLWLSRHIEFLTGNIRHPIAVGFDSLGRELTTSIKNGIRQGKIRNLKANEIWTILFGVPLSYARDWLDGYNPNPPTSVAENLAECCWRALKS
jgi:AcrR family transcriptional regulator